MSASEGFRMAARPEWTKAKRRRRVATVRAGEVECRRDVWTKVK